MKKLLARKKNNKGFSLVELIVVILIMAIIAVALAPQVMKWVGRSSKSTDENNAATIKSAVQTAVADCISEGTTLTSDEYYVLQKGISTASGTWTEATDALGKKIKETLGEFPEVKADNNKVFEIKVVVDATDQTLVTVTVSPVAGTYKAGAATPATP